MDNLETISLKRFYISSTQGCWIVHCVGVERRKKARATFFGSVKLWPHSDIYILAPFFLEPEDIKCLS